MGTNHVLNNNTCTLRINNNTIYSYIFLFHKATYALDVYLVVVENVSNTTMKRLLYKCARCS